MPTSIMSSNLQQLRHFLADLLTGVARMAVSERMPCPKSWQPGASRLGRILC
jgi:hypothetical protein